MTDVPTVFIIDDHDDARASLSAMVQSMGVACECYSTPEEFLSEYSPKRRGCVVTDMRMLGMSGLELLEKLEDMGSDLPVILISAYSSIPIAVQAMQAGAVTFLEKTCSDQELWQAISDALRQNELRRKKSAERESILQVIGRLSAEERKVMELISQGQANKQVAHTLDIGLRTVEDRRRRVMQKLGVKSFAELMRVLVKAELVEHPEKDMR
ncbi:MAG: response regulator transcription factor [Planctomycetaceae bacterium]